MQPPHQKAHHPLVITITKLIWHPWQLSRTYMLWCNSRQIFPLGIVITVCGRAQGTTSNVVVRSKEALLCGQAAFSGGTCINTLRPLIISRWLLLFLLFLLWLLLLLEMIRPEGPIMVSFSNWRKIYDYMNNWNIWHYLLCDYEKIAKESHLELSRLLQFQPSLYFLF